MFASDIALTTKEKADLYYRDGKAFVNSLKDAVETVKEAAFVEQTKEDYVEYTRLIINGLKHNYIQFRRLVGGEEKKDKHYNGPLVPLLNKNDERLKLAKFS